MSLNAALQFIEQISYDEELLDEYLLAQCRSEEQIIQLAANCGFEFDVQEFRQGSKLYLSQYTMVATTR